LPSHPHSADLSLYDPRAVRWQSRPKTAVVYDQSPAFNIYVYAGNDPINRIDLTGQDAEEWFLRNAQWMQETAIAVATISAGGALIGGLTALAVTSAVAETTAASASTLSIASRLPGLASTLAGSGALAKIIGMLYKPGDVLPGGTAGALEYEKVTGESLSPAGHGQAALERARLLMDLLRNYELSAADRAAAEAELQKLIHAINRNACP
jgi:hypothetical protein